MFDLDTWSQAASLVFQWGNLLLIVGTALVGLVTGLLPGIGPLNTLPLFIPLTFAMQPHMGILVLAVLYVSSVYGGSISAILLNTPGTASSAATCFDGYPMAQQGKAGVAIGLSMMSSLLGGAIGMVFLIFFSPVVADVALKFQPAEYFMLAALGLVLIATSARGSVLKSLVIGCLGFTASSVGMDVMTGQSRFAFGSTYLQGGLPFVPLVVGLFAFSEVLCLVEKGQGTIAEKGELSGGIWEGLKAIRNHLGTLVRSSLVGLGIGTIPGEGAAVANFTAYLIEVRSSKNPETFGTGNPAGVVAAEASNNACVAGTLIPTLTLGIPGGGVAAIFMGGLMMHGLNPGMELFTRNKDVLYTLFFGLAVGNFLIFLCGVGLAKVFARITTVPVNLLVPGIIILGVVSTYLYRSNFTDVLVAIVAGIFGYVLRRQGYSLVPLLVGFILAPIAERSFFQALIIADGSYLTFVRRPISAILFALIVLAIFLPPLLQHLRRRGKEG